MSTVDASGAIHGTDGRFAGHIAGEPDSSVKLAGGATVDDRLQEINVANLDLQDEISRMQTEIDSKVAELEARKLAADLMYLDSITPGGLDLDGATASSEADDEGDWTVNIYDRDGGIQVGSDPMTQYQAALFSQRYGFGPDDPERIDVAKIRASVMTPLERVQASSATWLTGADHPGSAPVSGGKGHPNAAYLAGLMTVRHRIRTQCPSARYVGVIDMDGSYEVDAVTDANGTVLPFQDPGDGEIFDALQDVGDSDYGNVDGTGLAPRWSRGKYHRLYDLDNLERSTR